VTGPRDFVPFLLPVIVLWGSILIEIRNGEIFVCPVGGPVNGVSTRGMM
jgi:hypothetical protein